MSTDPSALINSIELPKLSPDPGPELGGEPVVQAGLVPLSSTTWEGFTPKQKWDVIVSLRGPDTQNSETMKWFTTSVIRGKMRKVMRVGGTVNTDLNLIILPSGSINGTEPEYPYEKIETPTYPGGPMIKRRIPVAPPPSTTKWQLYRDELFTYLSLRRTWSESHFFQHVREAAEILDIPVVYVEGGRYLKAIGHYDRKAAKLFAEALTGPPSVELKRHIEVMDKRGYE